jgi:hypothetical protein
MEVTFLTINALKRLDGVFKRPKLRKYYRLLAFYVLSLFHQPIAIFSLKSLTSRFMKRFLNIFTFLLIFSITAEKVAIIFIANQNLTELAKTEESKKSTSGEETDSDKKLDDTDKYYKSCSHINGQYLSIAKRFSIGDTPLNSHPYHKDDPKPPKAA